MLPLRDTQEDTQEDREGKQEATVNLAAANEISRDAAAATGWHFHI